MLLCARAGYTWAPSTCWPSGDSNGPDDYAKLGEGDRAIAYVEQALAIFEAVESPYATQACAQLARLRGEAPLEG